MAEEGGKEGNRGGPTGKKGTHGKGVERSSVPV